MPLVASSSTFLVPETNTVPHVVAGSGSEGHVLEVGCIALDRPRVCNAGPPVAFMCHALFGHMLVYVPYAFRP